MLPYPTRLSTHYNPPTLHIQAIDSTERSMERMDGCMRRMGGRGGIWVEEMGMGRREGRGRESAWRGRGERGRW